MDSGSSVSQLAQQRLSPARRLAVPRRRKESDPTWMDMTERAFLPQGCIPSEDFWKLTDEDREWYKDKIDGCLGYIPSPYQKPRARDLPGLRLSRAEQDNGIFRDLPALALPKAAPGHILRANK